MNMKMAPQDSKNSKVHAQHAPHAGHAGHVPDATDLPSWKMRPRRSLPFSFRLAGQAASVGVVRKNISERKLATVCQEAQCPNLGHCWAQGTATYLIMGTNCTRRCGFCHISTARPTPLNRSEPQELAQSVADLGLEYVVITSVDRDDLPDCGSHHFASCIRAVQERNRHLKIETLIPDFKGRIENLLQIWQAAPLVINHNVETVPSLYRSICPQSNYRNSLRVLEWSGLQGFLTKSGLILGLGETLEEVKQVIQELAQHGVQILTIGQYLQPSPQHAPCKQYVSEEVFAELKEYALAAGMGYVESGPLVRSSFHARATFDAFLQRRRILESS